MVARVSGFPTAGQGKRRLWERQYFIYYTLTEKLQHQQILWNSRKYVDSEKIRAPDGISTHDPPWSSRTPLSYWNLCSQQGSNCGYRLKPHRAAKQSRNMISLTASRCHTKTLHLNLITASCRHIKAYRDASNHPPKWVYVAQYRRAMQFQSILTIWPLLTTESPVAQWLEHSTRSRRVVDSNPIWDSDFFRVYVLLRIS